MTSTSPSTNPHPTVEKSVRELFNIDVPAEAMIGVRKGTSPNVPPIDPHYVARRENLADFVFWLSYADPSEWLYLNGPTGTGKSSLVRHMAAKLNVPLYEAAGHDMLDIQDIFTQRTVIGGDVITTMGPLATAYQNGGWFLFNEGNLCRPGSLVALNDIGSVITLLDMAGLQIRPHPDFRLIFTGNGAGQADPLYAGTNKMNMAFMDRFMMMEVGYPEPEIEQAIISQSVSDHVPDVIIAKLVQVANEVRKLFAGENGQRGTIDTTISTRSLRRWAVGVEAFFGNTKVVQPVTHALDRAIALKSDPATRKALHLAVATVFGSDERNPPVG